MFHDILERKNAFLGYETRCLKNRKMGVFRKGLVHGFRLKVSIFPSFCFRQKRPGKCVSRYSRKKKRFSKTIETRSLKGQKFVFFPKGLAHDFGQKLAIFPFFSF